MLLSGIIVPVKMVPSWRVLSSFAERSTDRLRSAMLRSAQNKPDARAFLRALLEPEAQRALGAQGFGPPQKAKPRAK